MTPRFTSSAGETQTGSNYSTNILFCVCVLIDKQLTNPRSPAYPCVRLSSVLAYSVVPYIADCVHLSHSRPSPSTLVRPLKAECGTTESVWACLHCQHFGCGRGGKKHALDHYKESGHPCVVLIGADKYVYCYECDDYVANDTADGDIKQLRKQLNATEVHSHVVSTEPQLNHSLTRSGRVLRKSSVSRDEIKAKYENRDRLETAMQRWRSNLLYSAFNTWRDMIRKGDDGKGAGDEKSRAKRKNAMVQVPGVTGLRNLGQTCFMNVVLQCLSNSPPLRLGVRELSSKGVFQEGEAVVEEAAASGVCKSKTSSGSKKKGKSKGKSTTTTTAAATTSGSRKKSAENELPNFSKLRRRSTIDCREVMERKPDNMKRRGGKARAAANAGGGGAANTTNTTIPMCNALDMLFRILWSGKWSVVTPFAFLESMWKAAPAFEGFRQQDAQELLSIVFDKIESELTALKATAEMKSPKAYRQLLDVLQGGVKEQRVDCLHCKNVSTREEKSSEFSLDFPSESPRDAPVTGRRRSAAAPDSYNLTKLLELYTEGESLEGIYRCDRCSTVSKSRGEKGKEPEVKYRDAVKSISIRRPGPIIRFHIKRFRWSGIKREKVHTLLTFPFVLDLRKVRGWSFSDDDRDDDSDSNATTDNENEHESDGAVGAAAVSGSGGIGASRSGHRGSSRRRVLPAASPGRSSESGAGGGAGSSSKTSSLLFDLTGIICHEGKGMSGGHYFSYCKHYPSGEWYLFNDHRVSRASVAEVQAAQAYMLFYSQRVAMDDLQDNFEDETPQKKQRT